MRHLRALVYWLGFRPKPNTILYSPSREFMLWGSDASKRMSGEE